MRVLTADFKATNAPEIFTESLIKTGFAVLKNHPLNFAIVEEAYQRWAEFFCSDEKLNFMFDKKKQDGYFPITVSETAKGNTIKDIKEYFQIYPWGRCPVHLNAITRDLYNQLANMAATLLQWIEQHTPENIRRNFSMHLSEMITDSPETMLRILYYPALNGNEEIGAIRAADHEDINLITLLPAATEPGLQVKDIYGVWHDVECDPQTIVVNTGDMLQMCSQGYYRSTTHRVINPEGDAAKKARLSMPLFLHPRRDVRLSETHTQRSYLLERLKELGVI